MSPELINAINYNDIENINTNDIIEKINVFSLGLILL